MTISLFSGQGSQYPGMGKDIAEASPSLSGIFDTGSEILGRDLKAICFDSTPEELAKTINAQPAIMAVSLLCLNAAVENYISALKDKNVVDENADADDYKVDANASTVAGENVDGDTDAVEPEKLTVTGEITDIKTSVNDGNTVYYLQVKDKYYYITVTDCMDVLLMKKGDKVTVTYTKDSDKFIKADNVEIK